jgi:hypothetical protein
MRRLDRPPVNLPECQEWDTIKDKRAMTSLPKMQGAVASAAETGARQAAHEAKPWVELLARLGYTAKGVVYTVIGWLALMAAIGNGGKKTSAGGALATIAAQPFGQVLLGTMAIGLAGYALWRIVQALFDPQHKGTDARGIAKRIGYFISGIAYGGLALTAVRILQGTTKSGDSGKTQDMTARLLALPLGRLVVMGVGLVLIGIGINSIYTAAKEKFQETLRWNEMSPTEQKWANIVGKIGYTAKGLVSVIIGGFLILAGVRSNASEARGLDGALKVLAQQPYGPWLLGIVAAGLVAYGLYSFMVESQYRRVFDRSASDSR